MHCLLASKAKNTKILGRELGSPELHVAGKSLWVGVAF